MTNYFLKRLFQSVLVMLIVAFVSFSLFNFVGDPVNNMVGQEASDERREEIRDKLGINDPIYVQFFTFTKNIIKGNFGISYQLKRPVSELISELSKLNTTSSKALIFLIATASRTSEVIGATWEEINLEDLSLLGAAELTFNGWHAEAIPYTKEKKSLFTGIFSRFFN